MNRNSDPDSHPCGKGHHSAPGEGAFGNDICEKERPDPGNRVHSGSDQQRTTNSSEPFRSLNPEMSCQQHQKEQETRFHTTDGGENNVGLEAEKQKQHGGLNRIEPDPPCNSLQQRARPNVAQQPKRNGQVGNMCCTEQFPQEGKHACIQGCTCTEHLFARNPEQPVPICEISGKSEGDKRVVIERCA